MAFNAVALSPVQPPRRQSASVLALFFYFCCLVTYAIAFFDPDTALKCLTFSAVLSLYIIYRNINNLFADKRLLIFPTLVLAFGILQILWVFIFKQPDTSFSGAYRSYQNAGKVLIFSAFILAALFSCPPRQHVSSNLVQGFIILLGLAVYTTIGYDLLQQPSVDITKLRIRLPEQQATGAAYSLTFLGLLVSQAAFRLKSPYGLLLFFINLSLSYLAIVLTQTRAAILVYPVLIVALFIIHYRAQRQVLLRSALAMVILMLIGLVSLQSVLEKRFYQLKSDISAYQNENSKTSVGARLAMQRAGLEAGATHLLGQSLEQRSLEIKERAKQDTSLKGAVAYLNTHMHNEAVDTFSLKGIPGTLLLLFLYLSAVFVSVIYRSGLLLMVTGTVIAYGLSDLMLYAKSEALMSMLALAAAVMLLPNHTRAKP